MSSSTLEALYLPPPKADAIGNYLRHGRDAELTRRRAVVALSLASAGVMGVIGLYQVGVLRNVPDPPGKWFNGNKVNGSAQAYQVAQTPDALLGLVSYGVTAALAAAGGRDRAQRHPWLSIALAAKASVDAAAAAKLSIDQPVKYKSFCALCIGAAAATFVALAATLPDAFDAARTLAGRRPTPGALKPNGRAALSDATCAVATIF